MKKPFTREQKITIVYAILRILAVIFKSGSGTNLPRELVSRGALA